MSKAKILGKLKGIIASARESSRNGRTYTSSFWDAKFDSDLFKEGLQNKVFLGELYHPDDVDEYSQIHCDDRSAVVLVDVKKKDLDYEGTFEILPTKAGQCLRNLLDIGCIFGISSRGLADYDADVYDENMASKYDLITWDVVAFPGLKCCRLHEVGAIAESFNKKSKERIMENLNQISKNDKDMQKYIKEALEAKEEFTTDMQIEDILSEYPDYAEYADVVVFDKDGIPYYDDKKHGKKRAFVFGDKNPKNFGKPGDVYLVDNISYNDELDGYLVVGDWTKLNY